MLSIVKPMRLAALTSLVLGLVLLPPGLAPVCLGQNQIQQSVSPPPTTGTPAKPGQEASSAQAPVPPPPSGGPTSPLLGPRSGSAGQTAPAAAPAQASPAPAAPTPGGAAPAASSLKAPVSPPPAKTPASAPAAQAPAPQTPAAKTPAAPAPQAPAPKDQKAPASPPPAPKAPAAPPAAAPAAPAAKAPAPPPPPPTQAPGPAPGLSSAPGTPSVQAAPSGRATQISVVLTPRNQAVLSAEVSGVVMAVAKEFGQTFEPGEALVRLDPTVYKANQAQAAAALEAARSSHVAAEALFRDKTVQKKAQAVLAAARADYEAKEKLFATRSISLRDLEATRRDLRVAEANSALALATTMPEYEDSKKTLAQAQARFKIAEKEMEACTVQAPYKGRVEKVLVNVSELVERGRPLIQVIDDSVLRAKFLAPSVAVQSIRPGMSVGIEVMELGQRITGRISHVSAVLDPASGTFEVYAEVDNPGGTLRSGMTGLIDPSSLKN